VKAGRELSFLTGKGTMAMFRKLWSWMRDADNLKVAVFVTGLLGTLGGGIYKGIEYYHKYIDPKVILTATVNKGDFCYQSPHTNWTCPPGRNCNDELSRMSILDIAINNQSELDLVITEVTLIPEWIYGHFWAGAEKPSKKYDISIDEWVNDSICFQLNEMIKPEDLPECRRFDRNWFLKGNRTKVAKMETTAGWEAEVTWIKPREIKVAEIPADKYFVKSKTIDHFQIELFLTDPTRYLYGSIYAHFRTDNGLLLKSDRLHIYICCP
jgi:hypothetical protein